MDSKSQEIIYGLHPKFRPLVQAALEAAQDAMPSNVKIVLIAGMRSFEESNRLYAIGRTVKGENSTPSKPMGDIVTKAAAGQSYHNYGLSVDFEMLTNGKPDYVVGPNWLKVVSIMEAHGMTWGGNFPEGFHDNPHFEDRFGKNWRDLLVLYNAGKFLPDTQYVDF